MNRITHPQQMGARVSPLDSLFQTVDQAITAVEPIPTPEVTDSDWQSWDDAVQHQDKREQWRGKQ